MILGVSLKFLPHAYGLREPGRRWRGLSLGASMVRLLRPSRRSSAPSLSIRSGSLGIISKPRELAIIEVAVFLLVAQALAINRLAGLPYPLWDTPARTNSEGADRGGTL